MTASLPEVVQRGLEVESAVVYGEVVVVTGAGLPLPFQHLMRRFRRVYDVTELVHKVPVQLHLFDLLNVDGQSLVDLPNRERWRQLEHVVSDLMLVPRTEPGTVEEGGCFTEKAHRAETEGVMARDFRSAYTPGVRGRTWLKLKHVMPLDCAIVAAEWGYRRRHGWLTNYHLAIRDERTGGFQVVGKSFKGLTGDEFRDMTEKLLALEVKYAGGMVYVRPQVIVVVLFKKIGAACKEQGLQFCYHNHAFDFQTLDGRSGMDILFEDTDPKLVQVEVDTYWVQVRGFGSRRAD